MANLAEVKYLEVPLHSIEQLQTIIALEGVHFTFRVDVVCNQRSERLHKIKGALFSLANTVFHQLTYYTFLISCQTVTHKSPSFHKQ